MTTDDWDHAIIQARKGTRALTQAASQFPEEPLTPQQRKALARTLENASAALGALRRAAQKPSS